MDANDNTMVPTVFLVSNNPLILNALTRSLTPQFAVTAFNEITPVVEALIDGMPDVIVVDRNLRPRGAANMIMSQAAAEGRFPCLMMIAGRGESFEVDTQRLPGPYRLLRLPLSKTRINKEVSALVGEAAELRWQRLPKIVGGTLRLTVKQFREVEDAVLSGQPIDYANVEKSCQVIDAAVQGNAHHDLLTNAMEHHDYSYVHALRVTTLMTLFGYGLGMRGYSLLTLAAGGMLLDIGKLTIPFKTLNKPGDLDEEEWKAMRDHPRLSGEILRKQCADVTNGALIIAEQHHEKLDGTGYPTGLKGAELNVLARVAAIVDMFAGMTDPRQYRSPFKPEQAFIALESMEGQIDQGLLKVFKDIYVPGSSMDTRQMVDAD